MYQQIPPPKSSTTALIIKCLCISSGALITAFALAGLVMMILHDLISKKFFLVFSPIFITMFGVVMIGVQYKIGFVVDNFDFLTTLLGKGIFYIYISSCVFFFFTCGPLDEVVLAWISSMIIFGLGILFIVLNFCATGYGNEVKQQLN